MVRIAKNKIELDDFLTESIELSKFEVDRIKLNELHGWNLANGALSHNSGGFFDIVGVKNITSGTEHLAMYQPQSALTGLALCKVNRQAYVLLQARIEPGNSFIGQFGPTVQSTPANYLQVHGGKKTSYVDMFTTYQPNVQLICQSMQFDLGKRYFQKSKTHSYVEVPKLIETTQNSIWVPLSVIMQVVHLDNYLNADLRSLLAIFDWDQFMNDSDTELYETGSVNRLIESGIGPIKPTLQPYRMVAFRELSKLEMSEESIFLTDKPGISVGFYRTSIVGREVSRWFQPLMVSADLGKSVLQYRYENGMPYFLVTVEHEFGISGGVTVLPSYVRYPGDQVNDESEYDSKANDISFIQSDEGGRFYRHENVYQIQEVNNEMAIGHNQYWISALELKSILTSSNLASFQLRCIASLVMNILYPNSCATESAIR